MSRRQLTDKLISNLRPKAERYSVTDPEQRGHYLRVMPSGTKTFVAVCRDVWGKQQWVTVGGTELTVEQSREKAREIIRRVRSGLPAFEPPPIQPDTYNAVAQNFLVRHVEKEGLRSKDEIKRVLDKYILPVWGSRDFISIGRTDIAHLLDHVEDAHGSRQADVVLAVCRKMSNWFASRHDTYISPFVRGMGRVKKDGNGCKRVLSRDEVKKLWTVAEQNGVFGAICRLALLTAQRREKLATLKWSDISIDGIWVVDTADREKGSGGELLLPPQALAIISAQQRVAGNPYVFAGRKADGYFNGFSKAKRTFDAKLKFAEPWTIHDLRRTAATLMADADVPSDTRERVLGHAIPGVAGTYNRSKQIAQKANALRTLSVEIEKIVSGGKGKVLGFAKRKAVR
jgi:integrase